jgi:hypothetical protein
MSEASTVTGHACGASDFRPIAVSMGSCLRHSMDTCRAKDA